MNLSDFNYDLPPELIAKEPLPERDASRLLCLDRATGRIEHKNFRDLPELLDPGDLLVANRSRVIPARLLGRRPGAGKAEILLVRRLAGPEWEALVRPGRRLRQGAEVTIADGFTVRIESEAVGSDGRRRVRLQAADPENAIRQWGHVPLPPYIGRADTTADRNRYQTVYAQEPGSVAAPTAGLHFTSTLQGRLAQRGVGWAEVVLHVGPGTFKPVTVDDVSQHEVGPETYQIEQGTMEMCRKARSAGGRIIAVGTTSVRTLETCASSDGAPASRNGQTTLVVIPGFRFQATDALITNFHLPKSSLLFLVSAFAGRERILRAYREAIRHRYRFYSYGDAMLIT